MKGVVGLRAVVLLLLQALVANGFLNGGAATVTRRRSAGLKAQEIVDLPMPDEIARENCMEDIVFCERLPEVQETGGGLFLPDKGEGGQHVARVVSVGPGRNEQRGWITPNTGVKKGDLVFLKFPWGIGPRDEEYTDETGKLRRFSYIRYQDVASVVQE